MPVDGCKRGALANDMRPLCLHAPAPSRIPAPGAATAAPAAQFITAVVAYGTRESASFNFVVKGSDILLIILILCLSFPHANKHNWDDFWHFGDQGVFSAAGIVFFAYSGAPAALPHPPRSRVLRCMCGGSSRGDACLLLTQGTTPHATWQRRCAARPRPARPSARPQAGRRRLLLRCPPPTPRLTQHRRHRALCTARSGASGAGWRQSALSAAAARCAQARDPGRDLPIAIIGSLTIAAVLVRPAALPGIGLRPAQRRASRRPLRHAGALWGPPCALAEYCLERPSRRRALSAAVLPRRS